MTNGLIPFDFRGSKVRVVELDGEPWFVAADVCFVLGYSNGRDAVAKHVRDTQKGVSRIATPSGDQQMTVVNEGGLYRLLMRARTVLADDFQDWVTDEVLPTIRKTGGYGNRFEIPASFAEALELAARQARELDEAHARNAVLEPAAHAWDHLVDTGATLDIAAAAKKLRDAGVLMGRTRLYAYLRKIGWVFAYGTQPKQSAVDTGWVAVDWGKPYVNAKTGETEQGDAKTRVTPKGMAELLRRLAPESEAS
jgi:prophage antirepressor-like protein